MAWNEPGNGGRDPWNQGRRGDGGPDLDQMLERLKARFKGKGSRPGPLPLGSTGMLAGAVVLVWLLSGVYSVDAQELGVVLRLGAYARTVEPGLKWHLPWPLETVERVSMTQVRQVTERADLLTQDENIVDVEVKVQYQVRSAEDYLFGLEDPEGTLRQVTKATLRQVVGATTLDTLLASGRQTVAEQTRQLLQERLDAYHAGLQVGEVSMSQARVPEAVQGAFDDAVNKAPVDQKRLHDEAETYASDKLPKARGAAAREIADATGYRDRLIARAQGEADRFDKVLAEYRKAPKVTRDRLYLETMSEVLGRSSKVIVDTNKNGPVINLTLDPLGKGAARAGDSDASQAPAARSGPGDSRPRDRGGP